MGQDISYKTAILDEFWTTPVQSQCWHCSLLIDGCCDMTCQKYPEGFSGDYWNNTKPCPDRKELSGDNGLVKA